MSLYKSFDELGTQPEQNQDQFAVPEIIDDQQKKQIISQNRVVVVYIFADWCGPCKQIAPSFSLLYGKYTKPGECFLVKENLDKKLTPGIQGIPTFHFYLEGRKLNEEIVGGDLDSVESTLLNILKTYQPRTQTTGPHFNKSTIRAHGSPGNGVNQQPYQPGRVSYYNQEQYFSPPPQGGQVGQGQRPQQPSYQPHNPIVQDQYHARSQQYQGPHRS